MAENDTLCAIILWRIENFSCCSFKKGQPLYSDMFVIESLSRRQYSWYVSLYPGGDEDSRYVPVSLLKVKETTLTKDVNISAKMEFSVLDKENSQHNIGTTTFVKIDRGIGFKHFLLRSLLFKEADTYLPGDTLRICIRIFVSEANPLTKRSKLFLLTKLTVDGTGDKLYNSNKKSNGSLKTDVLQMYRDGFMSDFNVQVGSRMFPVHANILGSRSNVLRCMLETNMQEKQEKVLKLEDLDEATVDQFLQYLYTDDPGDLCVDSALKLYYASDKYDIGVLKEETRLFLKKNLDTKNVFDILVLSDRHNDKELKTSAIQFVSRHEKNVVLSDKFRLFSKENSQLSVDILLGLSEMRLKD